MFFSLTTLRKNNHEMITLNFWNYLFLQGGTSPFDEKFFPPRLVHHALAMLQNYECFENGLVLSLKKKKL